MNEVMPMAPPIKKFRAGACCASIFENPVQTADGVKNLKNVRLARAYKSRDGEWRETPSFRESDIPKAIVALQKAYEYLVMEASKN